MVSRIVSKLVFVFLLIALLATTGGYTPAAAAGNCWCVDVALNAYGIRAGFYGKGDAKDLGPYLLSNGFVETKNPTKGDVVVMQPAVTGNPAGHTGLIETISSIGDKWHFNLKQNKGTPYRTPDQPYWSEYGCPNVGIVGWAARSKNDPNIKYYHKGSPQPAPTGIWQNGKSYLFKSANAPHLALDLDNGKTANGTRIIQWEAHGEKNQVWVVEAFANGYYRLHSAVNYQACIVVQYASKSNGGKIIVSSCSPNGQGNEWWQPIDAGNGNIVIKNQLSGLVLDQPGAKADWGLQIQQYTANGTLAQQWISVAK